MDRIQEQNNKKRSLHNEQEPSSIDIESTTDEFIDEDIPNDNKTQRLTNDLTSYEDASSPEVIDITGDDVEEDDDEEDDEDDEDEEDEEIENLGMDEEVQIVDNNGNLIEIVNDQQNTKTNGTQSNKGFPLANEFDELSKKLLKPIPDLPTKDETYMVWEIKDWASLVKNEKVRSPTFSCGGFEWNILLFPKGNNHSNMLSVYMEPHPPKDEDDKPIDENWYVCAQFGLDFWNPLHPEAHFPNQSSHRFSKDETDWGFSALIDLRSLTSAKNLKTQPSLFPILENNQLNITGFVKVIDDSSTGVLWHNLNNYDSKVSAGFVGLNNQGATCYLNSLLQSYFTTKLFRKLVYQIPTENSKNAKVALALQRIFYLLTNSNDPVGTMELTKSFGWDSSDAFTQHDVQELNRILMDKLETAMKGSEIEKGLNDIFVGKMKSYIKCVNVPYESSRVEDFWDIQLNVKGCKNLEQSFKNYVEIEMLDGENKYQAGEEFGYQDAKKGVVFESFPPVLHLQLKRFEYDFMVDDLVKIDDFYEFPDKIDLAPFLDEDLPTTVKNENWTYKLHGVLVHQGTISNGHYYAMIKPNSNGGWLRFDDDKVWKVTPTEVFNENFGAAEIPRAKQVTMSRSEQTEHMLRRVTSAYMLVYYRETELDSILPEDFATEVVPKHISNQIKFELEEKQRLEKERQEALYYCNAKVITVDTINNNLGCDLSLDATLDRSFEEKLVGTLCDPKTFKVKKDSKFSELVSQVGEFLGYEDSKGFRLVVTCHRNNHTNRLDVPVKEDYNEVAIFNVYGKLFNRKYDEMVFYVEELNKDIKNINQLTTNSMGTTDPANFSFDEVFNKIKSVGTDFSDDMQFKSIDEYSGNMTIFIKYFDPISQEIRALSHITVSTQDQIKSIIEPVRKLLNFGDTVEFDLFEELSPYKLERLDPNMIFDKHELSNGDIITFQVSNVESLAGDAQFKNLKEYYKFLATRHRIRVKPFNANLSDEDSDYVDEEEPQNGQDNDVQTIKEIEEAKKLSKSFELWVSSTYSYQDLALVLSKHIKCDPEYLKIFAIGNNGTRYPLKTTSYLSQFLPKQASINNVYDFEYEILNIKIKDYENLKGFKVYWFNNLLQLQMFELLVPKNGNVRDIINKLLHKVQIPESNLKHILCYTGYNHKFEEILRFDKPVLHIRNECEIFVGVFPAEVEALVQNDIMRRFVDVDEINPEEIEDSFMKEEYLKTAENIKNLNLIPAFHFHKHSTNHHGAPFIMIIYPDEYFPQTKERLRQKLGLGRQAFDKIKIALANTQDKGVYLDLNDEQLKIYDKTGTGELSLALDHPDRNPKRQSQFDKGISIK
ncbi:UBP15 [Candida jiufengensis]|uniref:UBP15 n=1 Tax=Candida jiufengensis TaxID=497108 RepID=UPI002224ACDA|nr:UBP15 [Candida jiufengensis]KAI5952236.1 UBP15 [Candida jiufengensis]